MASGRPDYTALTLMMGNNAGTLRNVGVDAAGNILTLIKGQFGGAPVTIAVDAGGNILGILQGDYAGSLKTLAVDAQGRMLAVLTDPEDVFGNPHYMGAAELAARGGYLSLERRGQLMFYDAGGAGLVMYDVTTNGASSAVTEDSTFGHLIPKSYKFVTGPNDGEYAQIDKYLPIISESGHGLEVTFSIDLRTKYVELLLDIQGLGYYKQGRLRYSTHDLMMQVWSSAGAWVNVSGVTLSNNNKQPHFMKLSINPTTGKYVRVRLDQYEYPLGGTSLYAPAPVYDKRVKAQVNLVCHDGGAATAYVSNLAVTCHEV
jgi:hypothetical protein